MDVCKTLIDSENVCHEIERILQRGNAAEVKREQGNLVVVEIKRQVVAKTAIKG